MPTPPADADAALFQALVESSADVFALLDARGNIRYVSPSIEDVLGHTPAERIGKSAFALIHEDDMAGVAETFTRVAALPGASQAFVCRVRHKDGTWRSIESKYVNRLTDPVGGIVVNYRDVSRQKVAEDLLRRSEARYRSIIHGALYGIFRSTMDGEILDANPAFARMLGYSGPEELRSVNMADIYADARERRAIVANSTQEIGTATVHWNRKDGAPIVVRVSGRIVDLEGSGATCFEAMAEDITEKRAREEQIRQSQKMEAVGRLARGLAHDFNNVLAAILGNADLIQLRLKKDDPIAADLDEISTAAERGAALTRQLLAFSRPRQVGEPVVLGLHEVVRGFDTMLQRLSGDIELRLHTPGASPNVRISPGQIEQVVMNLVLNAREALVDGGAIDVFADRVEVGAADRARYPALEPGEYARIAVRDNGPGISAAIRTHLFEPFFSTKDPAKGPGLGLSIVYGIARDAGGAVGVSSRPDEGTTFEVLLPSV